MYAEACLLLWRHLKANKTPFIVAALQSQSLRLRAANQPLQQLCQYVDATWLQSDIWGPANWSAFKRSIRTNNDVEGWHRRLNGRAGRHCVQFYTVVALLHSEASMVKLQMRLLRESKLRRCQQQKTKTFQGRIFKLWERYESGDLKTSGLLAACKHLTGPAL